MTLISVAREQWCMKQGTHTRYPGVLRLDAETYVIRWQFRDATGRMIDHRRLVEHATIFDAARLRAEALERETQQRRLPLLGLAVAPTLRDDCASPSPALPGEALSPALADYAQTWLATHGGWSPYSRKVREQIVRDHISPHLGALRLHEIRRAHVQAWVSASLAKAKAPLTVRGWFAVLRVLLGDARAEYELDQDPCARIRWPTTMRPSRRRVGLTSEDLGRLLSRVEDEAPSRAKLALVLARTGLRFCHATAIQWGDIDETPLFPGAPDGVLHIRRRQVRQDFGAHSSVKRAPELLPLTVELRDAFREQHRLLELAKMPRGSEDLVFPSAAGTALFPASFSACLARLALALGIRDRVTAHTLRRTFVDEARLAGVPDIVTQGITGHVSEDMLAHYSTVWLAETKKCLDAVSAGAIGTKYHRATGTDHR